MRRLLISGILLISPYAAVSQSPAPSRSFEVASIKPAAQQEPGRRMIGMRSDDGRVTYSNVTLRDVIRNAFKVKDRQIEGPDWLNSERYDIVAKFPSGATKDDIPVMLQSLLADRFKLTYHKDSKVSPIYAMIPSKGGPKVQPAESAGGMRMMMGPKGIHLSGMLSLTQLADGLSNFTDRIVVDKTNLKGTFDIDLEFKPEGGGPGGMMRMGPPGGGPGPGGPAGESHTNDDSDAPSLFTAIQEKLGLKLDPQKAPVDLYVIDQAEKVPTEN